ncbi:unnamed protein product [Spirodela intermedia]|uniref:Uncharacterized protein n=1 Tax=Spirodela intermedia TaxID=51605 RepID=A0A7I8JLZ9_SPIIN|nr:unnamed protein product [Spirodela intermedia]CAA6670845.1 unnamed protein product [Spirodela intermedia]
MFPSATESRGIFVLRKTPQGVGDALPLRALEAHELEELEDILAGALVDDLPIGEEDDVVEEVVRLRRRLEEGQCFPNSHLPDVEIILTDPSFPPLEQGLPLLVGSFSKAAHFSASSSSSSLDDLENTSSESLQLFRLRLPTLYMLPVSISAEQKMEERASEAAAAAAVVPEPSASPCWFDGENAAWFNAKEANTSRITTGGFHRVPFW